LPAKFLLKILMLLIVATAVCMASCTAQNQVDTNYIKEFVKDNNIKSISGTNRSIFVFNHISDDQMLNKRRIEANTSAFTGINFVYKWLSLEYDWVLPHTAVDNNYSEARVGSFHAFQLGKRFGFEGDYQKYSGLVLPVKDRRGAFDHFNNVNYKSYSLNLYYFFNFRRFSYNSAYKYSYLQARSAGSIILLLSPLYQSFSVNDTVSANISARDKRFIEIIQQQPKWFTLLSRVGYSYNFILDKGTWSINPSFLLGVGAETPLNNSRIFDRSLGLVNSYQARLNGGYNGDNFFIFLNLILDKTIYHLDNTQLNTINNFYAFNIGWRFKGLKKNVLWVL